MNHSPEFVRLVERRRSRVKECIVAEVKARFDGNEPFHFIDVREDHEYAADHARGARHLGKGIIERDVEAAIPNKQDLIVLYCGGGYRSVLAADALQQMGYANVISDGGWNPGVARIRLPDRITGGKRIRGYLFVRSNSLMT